MTNPFSNSYLILAAGNQTRWKIGTGIPKVKQLIEINGEILIKQIERKFPDAVTYTKTREIKDIVEVWYEPDDNLTTISTMFSTRAHWREWTIILLGDVLYGRKTVKRIKNQAETLMFYGDDEEIYAIKFHRSQRDNVALSIMNLIKHPKWETKYGKLWNLYRFMNGINFREHLIGMRFTHVFDCRDFDTKEEYLNYLNKKRS